MCPPAIQTWAAEIWLAEMKVRICKVRRGKGGADIDVDDVGIGARATHTGGAAVVAGDGQVIGAGEAGGAVIDHVVGRTKRGVDLGHASDQRDTRARRRADDRRLPRRSDRDVDRAGARQNLVGHSRKSGDRGECGPGIHAS
jgi:hypothetical protein